MHLRGHPARGRLYFFRQLPGYIVCSGGEGRAAKSTELDENATSKSDAGKKRTCETINNCIVQIIGNE